MKEDSDLKSKLHLNSRKLKRNKIVRKLMKPIVKPHHLDAIEREKGPNLNGFQSCTLWEKRTPQTFYEKVLQ